MLRFEWSTVEMPKNSFAALILNENEGKVAHDVQEVEASDLPEGDVLIRTEYSSLNYKDAMILGGIGRLVKNYPHVPGIDLAGVVEHSDCAQYKIGDPVLLTGWRVGETHWGGYAQKARVRSEWLVPLPAGFTTKQAMAIGTAGFTAMLAVMGLEKHGLGLASPGDDASDTTDVLVTGASGGVGSIAVAILSQLGYQVSASTGRQELAEYLKSLGATEIVDRHVLEESSSRPLESERWSAAIDTVGGTTLARVIAQLKYRASVAACGLVGGANLETTVIPFLLRGVNLLGIDSSMQPYDTRITAWDRLVQELHTQKLDEATTVIGLGELTDFAKQILDGQIRGRVVVDVNA